ncbi:uncharacterized protein LOC115214445 [Octopus sinensis]|uniref:Uncharacterized protein LOC115214445 n=1 Tax=Octopus sinensis TaxID=2607531 RepID=A0A6P7SM51_9MOLL|nr:uncharacterized protein LOC115214445 [Octopus sinensis]
MTGMSWSSCQRILSDELRMKRVATKSVLRFLTDDQKQSRLNACRELKDQLEFDPDLFPKVITGDESWCYGNSPETKQQSSQWKHSMSPCPKTARQVKSSVKTMLICFIDVKGIVHTEFVLPDQTVNQVLYLAVLKHAPAYQPSLFARS